MQASMVMLIALVIILIYFVTHIPARKSTKDVVYVNRALPVWNRPTGWARPLRRGWFPGWRPHFRPGFRPHPHHRHHH